MCRYRQRLVACVFVSLLLVWAVLIVRLLQDVMHRPPQREPQPPHQDVDDLGIFQNLFHSFDVNSRDGKVKGSGKVKDMGDYDFINIDEVKFEDVQSMTKQKVKRGTDGMVDKPSDGKAKVDNIDIEKPGQGRDVFDGHNGAEYIEGRRGDTV